MPYTYNHEFSCLVRLSDNLEETQRFFITVAELQQVVEKLQTNEESCATISEIQN